MSRILEEVTGLNEDLMQLRARCAELDVIFENVLENGAEAAQNGTGPVGEVQWARREHIICKSYCTAS